MSRRNFILLIIGLLIIVIWAFWFFAFRQPPTPGEEDGGFFSDINPFGDSGAVRPPYNTPSDGIPTTPPTQADKAKLSKISSMPVAGFGIFEKERLEKEFAPAVRYVERATGNIYQTFIDNVQERRFSNTVVPKVYEAFFGNSGESVIMRYLKQDGRTIQTYLGTLPKEVVGQDTVINYEIKGSFLPENIPDLALSPDTSKIFYLALSEESASGIILNLKDGKKTVVVETPFTEWLASWGNVNLITLTTKASGLTPGYVYNADVSKRSFTKIVGDISGLTASPSPDGKQIAISDSNVALSIYDVGTGEFSGLGVRTMAEKCVWADNITLYCAVPKNILPGLYPDSWYQGEVSFDDRIWKIDTVGGTNDLLADLSALSEGEEIDAIKPALDKSQKYLLFVNKKDSFLWKFDLE